MEMKKNVVGAVKDKLKKKAMKMQKVRKSKRSRRQGKLVLFCDKGAFTLDAVIPRNDWKDAQIQKIS